MTLFKSDSHHSEFRDAVLLVPGFLGLGRIGRFYYFSERIAAVLRSGIEARTGRPVLVVPCYTRPVGSLKDRQTFLLNQLQEVYSSLPKLERVHLVGHSAGAVDAQLLACDKPLESDSWEPFVARQRVCSVVGIAAPYHGTFLASSEAVRTLRGDASLRGARDIFDLSIRLTLLLGDQPALRDVFSGASAQFPEAAVFLWQMLRHRDLFADLEPEAMAELRKRFKPDKRIALTSFVTMAGMKENGRHSPDGFFRALYALCGQHASAAYPTMPEALRVLRASGDPAIDETTSDGVVNSLCQLLDPKDPKEFGGIVCADHADVIGHYDRDAKLLEDRKLQVGLFHSGSGFDDDEFFRLYGLVVDAICRSIPDTASTAVAARALTAVGG